MWTGIKLNVASNELESIIGIYVYNITVNLAVWRGDECGRIIVKYKGFNFLKPFPLQDDSC